ncbi:MAG TPA: zf-TFIIB domain-containing protein [Candidatus Acidoferrum sp.]|nr:zf-TFIIB domain-containing protein [Candidatus Acidoferrum sp.]
MNCPKCNAVLQARRDRGVEVQACPVCQGMWLTPAELDQLENEAFADEENKGSLFLVSRETDLKCPCCAASLKRFHYRFYDLELDFCPDHGFWLDKDDDSRILELMRGEEKRIETTVRAEGVWAKRMNHLRSPSFFAKLGDLFRR